MSSKRVLLLFLNTGGGHRSAALAVAEALRELYGNQVRAEPIDATTDYLTWPLSKLGAIYSWLVRGNGWPWALTYHLTDGPRRIAALKGGWCLVTGQSVLSLLDDHPADVIVCCHPLLKAPLAQALEMRESKAPLITLVTDLASGHAAWFLPCHGKHLVATEQAREQALSCGLSADAVEVTGLPVRPCFVRGVEQSPVLTRERLGLDPDRPVVLLLNGADGMGPFCTLVRSVMAGTAEIQVVAIAGHNKRLQAKLTSRQWPQPLHVKGFVDNMHDWMCAADLLVTKAGPATITEALTTGTPMIISGAIPGQEPPNVACVTETGSAVWAPRPALVTRAVHELLSPDNETLEHMSRRAQEASHPDAAWRVARIVWSSAELSMKSP